MDSDISLDLSALGFLPDTCPRELSSYLLATISILKPKLARSNDIKFRLDRATVTITVMLRVMVSEFFFTFKES